jgi:hypothetical protein
MMAGAGHRVAEMRSLVLHREVARRLREDERVLAMARRRVEEWLASGAVARAWAERWAEVLSGSVEEIEAVLLDPGERACDLRQVSPFAGALDPRTRWAILAEVGSAT